MANAIDSMHEIHHSNPCFQPLYQFLDPVSLILSQKNHVMERGPRYRAYADLRENKLRIRFEKQQQWEEIEFNQAPVTEQVNFSSNSGFPTKRSSVLLQSVPDFSSPLRKENRKPPVSGRTETTPLGTAKNWSKQHEREHFGFKQTPTKKQQVKFSSNSGVSSKGSSLLAQSVPDFSATLRKENRKPPVNGGIETTPPAKGKNWSNSGSKSANAGEKKKGRLMMMARKSYASFEELKVINGGNRGGKSTTTRLF